MTSQIDALPRASGERPQTARLRYEATILGLGAFAGPPLVLVCFVALGFLAGDPGRMLTGGIEAGVPLVVGIVAASLLAAEPALELQLSTAGGFRQATLRRLALLVAWAAILSVAGTAAGRVSGLFDGWPGRTGLAEDLLMPLAPLAAFATWGCLAGLALRSRGAAAAAVTSFWLAALAWKDLFLTQTPLREWYPFQFTFAPHAPDVLATRLTLLALAGLALVAVTIWLGRDEWLLGSEDR